VSYEYMSGGMGRGGGFGPVGPHDWASITSAVSRIMFPSQGECSQVSGGFKTWHRTIDLAKYGCRPTGTMHTQRNRSRSSVDQYPQFCCPQDVSDRHQEELERQRSQRRAESYQRCVAASGTMRWREKRAWGGLVEAIGRRGPGESCFPSGRERSVTRPIPGTRGITTVTEEEVCCQPRETVRPPAPIPGQPTVVPPPLPQHQGQQVQGPRREIPWGWIVFTGIGVGAIVWAMKGRES